MADLLTPSRRLRLAAQAAWGRVATGAAARRRRSDVRPPIAAPPPPTRRSSSETGAPVPGSQRDFVINAGDLVYFDFDRYEVRGDARQMLDKQAAWLRPLSRSAGADRGQLRRARHPGIQLRPGRPARRGGEGLSGRRAACRPRRIDTISYGKEKPIDPRQATRRPGAKNRNAHTVVSMIRIRNEDRRAASSGLMAACSGAASAMAQTRRRAGRSAGRSLQQAAGPDGEGGPRTAGHRLPGPRDRRSGGRAAGGHRRAARGDLGQAFRRPSSRSARAQRRAGDRHATTWTWRGRTASDLRAENAVLTGQDRRRAEDAPRGSAADADRRPRPPPPPPPAAAAPPDADRRSSRRREAAVNARRLRHGRSRCWPTTWPSYRRQSARSRGEILLRRELLIARRSVGDAAANDIGAIRGWPQTRWAPDAVADLARVAGRPEEARRRLPGAGRASAPLSQGSGRP